MQFSKEDIKNSVELSAFNRGYHYFKDGDVKSYELAKLSDENISLKSLVNGSGSLEKYEQDIDIFTKNDNIHIVGRCSCPIKLNCKHVVAVCLQYLSDIKNQNPTNKYDKWFLDLQIIANEKKFIINQTKTFITYRLFSLDTKTDTNDLKFYESKFLKNGNINQGKLLNSDKYLFSKLYDDLKFENDKNIIELCGGFFKEYGHKTTKLKGSLGYLVLQELIKTKRCFYKDECEVLTFSDEKISLEFDWEKVRSNDEESYNLYIKNLDKYELIYTNPILAIDKKENSVKKIDTDIKSEVLEQLLKIPVIPSNKVVELYKMIQKNSQSTTIFLPVELQKNIQNIVPTIKISKDEVNEWFELSFNIEFEGKEFPIAPLISGILKEFDISDDFKNFPEVININIHNDSFINIKSEDLKPILKTILALNKNKEFEKNLIVQKYEAHLLDDFTQNKFLEKNELIQLSKKLKDFTNIQKVKPSKSLNATLREYQQDGLNWLNFLYEFGFGGILADDMGLGKTLQTISHLSRLKEQGSLTAPSLIIMPTSLIANWKNEIKKFTPNLSILVLYGTNRADDFSKIDEYDIILTTYPLVVRDKEFFSSLKFFYIILDEAQKIKNSQTKMTKIIKELKSTHKLALSGTPIENHLGELHSIFDFLMPNFLGSFSFFKKFYQTPIEKQNDISKQLLLNKTIAPFILRRTKEKVVKELPLKSEIIKYTQFSSKQSQLYESIRVTMEKKVREAVEKNGLATSHITIFDALLKLRQVCCDPSLVKLEEALKVHESAKLELFLDLVEELILEKRKILVFSQFTSMLQIIEQELLKKGISFVKLTGSTTNREEVINSFTNGEVDIFLISLKAGGVGLNLTQADSVIHYDPWWNPAVENQATDRAYRIGQTKAVFVYRLIIENSIEQKILELQDRKKILQDGIFDENNQQENMKFSSEELLELLK